MKIKNLLFAAALVTVGAIASAQSTQRTFTYNSTDAVDQDYSAATSVARPCPQCDFSSA